MCGRATGYQKVLIPKNTTLFYVALLRSKTPPPCYKYRQISTCETESETDGMREVANITMLAAGGGGMRDNSVKTAKMHGLLF